MDIQAYISSGIIETYVLGICSTEESNELELLSQQYPEIHAAIESCQEEMEIFALRDQINPPLGLKAKIWTAIQQEDANETRPQMEAKDIKNGPTEEGLVSGLTVKPASVIQRRESGWLKYLAAASIVGLIISIGFNVIYQKKNQDYGNALAQIEARQQLLTSQNQLLKAVTAPNVKPIHLAGIPTHPNNFATVYWNGDTKEVYLTLNNLPAPPKGKQYQLWAIVDGKPVDAGLFDNTDIAKIQKLKVIDKAEMFAITLEPQGGSTAPTMDEMYVAGKI